MQNFYDDYRYRKRVRETIFYKPYPPTNQIGHVSQLECMSVNLHQILVVNGHACVRVPAVSFDLIYNHSEGGMLDKEAGGGGVTF